VLEKILVPVDGSELSSRILPHVRSLVHGDSREVVIATVVPSSEVPQVPMGGKPALDLALDVLEKAKTTLSAWGIAAKTRLVVGDPATRILELADEIRPSLIAMSTHGRSGVRRFVRGSVAERVLRSSPFPVFLVNPHDRRTGERAIKRILVPLDLSDLSAEIVPLAAAVAREHGAQLVLLHSLDVVISPDPVIMVSPTVSREDATAKLEKLAERAEGVPTRVRVALGAPSINILEVAREEDADLVAMTTHGRSGFSRWAFGSVAEQVLRNCPCPLLVMRTAGRDLEAPLAESERLAATPAAGSVAS